MPNPLKILENSLYKIRDLVWEYPDFILDENKFKTNVKHWYRRSQPYSHFLLSIVAFFLVFSMIS